MLLSALCRGQDFTWTPGGYSIAFGRMLQDGIVTRYLNDHVRSKTSALPYRSQLKLNADWFLWISDVFNQFRTL